MAEAMETDAIKDEDLFNAAQSGNVDVFHELPAEQLKRIISIRNEDARSLLHVAAAAGHLQIVRILAGIDPSVSGVNDSDEEGWTPLHSAVSSGRDDIVEALLQADAISTSYTSDFCVCPWYCKAKTFDIYVVCSRSHIGVTPITGADVSIANKGGRAALHYAASKGRLEIAHFLIVHGAKINQKDKLGCTPLHRAASTGHPELCEMLIEEGADVDATDKTGQTPLMHAVICSDKQVALLLVRHGADVDCEDNEGYTVLGRASNELRQTLIDAARVMLED